MGPSLCRLGVISCDQRPLNRPASTPRRSLLDPTLNFRAT